MTPNLERVRHDLDRAVLERDQFIAEQTRREQFDLDNRWRVERIDQLDQQLAQHWTGAVIDAARDGHPTAYGTHACKRPEPTWPPAPNSGPVEQQERDLQLLDHAIQDLAQQRARYLATGYDRQRERPSTNNPSTPPTRPHPPTPSGPNLGI